MRRGGWLGSGVVLLLAVVAACGFEPDLSRFNACASDGSCPTGTTCLAEAQRCLPDCGEQGPCLPDDEEPTPDAATDAGTGDGGGLADAGTDDAGTDDAGTDDAGSGDAGSGDAGSGDAGLADAGTGDAGPGSDGGTDAGEELSLVQATLEVATELRPYSVTFAARGGTAPYTFRAVQGLPPGLTLQAGGTLSGTPSQPAEQPYPLRVEVTDSSQPAARTEATYPLRVRTLLRVAGPFTLADAPQDAGYTEQLSATGGTKPYLFTLEQGQLPAGLELATTGKVTGKADSAGGPFEFWVRVTDSDTPAQSVVEKLTLQEVFSTLLSGARFTTRALPEARLGEPYRYKLQAWGTSSPKWELPNGTPPDGIVFDATEGVFSGTPAGASKSFNIRFSSGLTSETRPVSITVY